LSRNSSVFYVCGLNCVTNLFEASHETHWGNFNRDSKMEISITAIAQICRIHPPNLLT
jgi:hypothetical protein